MPKREDKETRRTFIKIMGAAGAGAVVAPIVPLVRAADKTNSYPIEPAAVPTRPYGKTGVDVSTLALGGVLVEF